MLHCGRSVYKLGIVTQKGVDMDKLNGHFRSCPTCKKAEDEAMKVIMHRKKKPNRRGRSYE